MVPRKGAEVAKISEKSLKDVLEVRRALDELIAQLACSRITKDQLSELKEAADEFENATKTEDTTTIARADIAFHDRLTPCHRTGNPVIMQFPGVKIKPDDDPSLATNWLKFLSQS